jgi:hypothetical protein
VEPEHAWSVEAVIAEMRSDVRHLQTDVAELRGVVRRIDGRVDQLFLVQIATLAATIGTLITALATALAT